MVFKRRKPLGWGAWLREQVYPRGGFKRAIRYVTLRMRRLPDQPHRVARGVFAGSVIGFLPLPGLQFLAGGAQAIPLPDASQDLALMLKSLHHVPVPLMAQALAEVARLLKPDGHLYVSEPVFAGPLNEVMRLFHDEQEVRAAAQAALDAALVTGQWTQAAEVRFDMPVSFTSFADFEQRMMRPTFADHRISNAKLAEVRHAFEPHCTAEGAWFERPMHVRLLTKIG